MKTRRNIFKRCISLLICIVMFTIPLLSCENKEDEIPQIKLSLWCAKDDIPMVTEMVDSFKEKYSKEANFTITISSQDESTCKDIVLKNIDGAADVYCFASDQFDALYKGNALLKITDEKESIIEENGGKDATVVRCASAGDDLYAYPMTSSNGCFLYYNAEYFSDDDITSLERMLDVAAEKNKKVVVNLSSGWYLYSFFKGAGLNVEMNEDGETNTCNWNSTEGKYKGVDVARAILDISTDSGFLSCDDEKLKTEVKNGNVIAAVNGTWNSSLFKEIWKENYKADKLPTYKIGDDELQMCSFVGYKMAGVSAKTDQPEWAMKLARWITNEENQLKRLKERGEAPTNVNVADSEEMENSQAIAALIKQSEYGYLQKVAESFWQPSYDFGTIMSAGNMDGVDLQELLDIMTEKITAKPKEENIEK